MKNNNTINIWGALVVACFAASLSIAQNKIADGELLKMLETATKPETATDGKTPVARTQAAVQAAGKRAAEADAVEEEAVASEAASEEGTIDDLGMVSYDEGTASSAGELISVRLNKVGLEEAINLFAQLSGANIIVPELTEAAQISVNLKDVEWRPALQSILDTYNYELYQRVSGSNVFSVRRRPVGAPEPQVVETFMLKYATVPNAAGLIRKLLPEDAKISEFASRNMLVVKSTESSLSEVRTVLATIDIVRQQVFIESKFMELSDGAQRDLGIDWQQLGDESGGISVSAGSPEDIALMHYADGNKDSEHAILPTMEPISKFSEHVLTSVLDVNTFNLVLNALDSADGLNVVSNPKIIVANEEKANISIIRKEPNIKKDRQASSTEGALDTTSYSLDGDMPFFEYGIKLDVTPSINTSSNITVSINPSLTSWVGEKEVGIDKDSYPVIDEKSVKTVFNLSDGETAAIGGLTKVTDSDIERKVPLLGSIPLLGRLFSWQQTISKQAETIIFVTVGLANTQQIDLETGLPEDSELARRRLIRDRNEKEVRDQRREHYKVQEGEKLDDTLQAINEKEAKRLGKRNKKLEKEQEKVARNEAVSI